MGLLGAFPLPLADGLGEAEIIMEGKTSTVFIHTLLFF